MEGIGVAVCRPLASSLGKPERVAKRFGTYPRIIGRPHLGGSVAASLKPKNFRLLQERLRRPARSARS